MTREPRRPSFAFERAAATVAAAVILGLVVFLVVRNEPFRDPTLAVITRIVLSLAVAVLGATIPGFLSVGWEGGGGIVKAGGAMALFVITFFGTPTVLQGLIADASREDYDHGVNSYNAGHYADAIDFLSRVKAESPMYPTATNMLGNSYFQLGRFSEAVPAYRRAMDVTTDRRMKLDEQYNIGLAHLYSKDFQPAKQMIVPLLDTPEMSTDSAVIFNAASVLYNTKDYAEAERVLSRFPFAAPLPTDGSSRDIHAKAHWLQASLLAVSPQRDCSKVHAELERALAIATYLKPDIDRDQVLSVCKTEEKGTK